MTLYTRWQDCPLLSWRWMHFTPSELACKGSGMLMIDECALDKLEAARKEMGKPFKINSAYRSPRYNRQIGGAPNSMHLQGKAFDIATHSNGIQLLERLDLYKACLKAGFTGFGFYPTFLHVDTGKKRSWINGAPWKELENI